MATLLSWVNDIKHLFQNTNTLGQQCLLAKQSLRIALFLKQLLHRINKPESVACSPASSILLLLRHLLDFLTNELSFRDFFFQPKKFFFWLSVTLDIGLEISVGLPRVARARPTPLGGTEIVDLTGKFVFRPCVLDTYLDRKQILARADDLLVDKRPLLSSFFRCVFCKIGTTKTFPKQHRYMYACQM